MTGEMFARPRVWKTAVNREAPRRLRPFLLLLADRAKSDGTVQRTTRRWLASRLGVTTRTVQRWSREAQEDGWLKVVQRGQKHVSAQVYGLRIPDAQGDTQGDIELSAQGDKPMLPEDAGSGRQNVSLYRYRASDSEHEAVKEDAPGENTTTTDAPSLPSEITFQDCHDEDEPLAVAGVFADAAAVTSTSTDQPPPSAFGFVEGPTEDDVTRAARVLDAYGMLHADFNSRLVSDAPIRSAA